MRLWQLLLRDIVLTGLAVFVIVSQVFSAHPSDVLLATALGLIGLPAADHAKAMLSGSTVRASSAQEQSSEAQQSAGSSAGSSGDPAP